ncbi:catalytic/ protein phosphatase type 2C [Panicum miliaceum]|uniref:Catalytic/ protein phosphatase type 2C n=1 Tax=Panicum miliaceum TaxID=4540 RepID=A0A3L6SDL5_PANMI|nr:catalytic/ protein phosphatase type 2C [Panicum miliaceum]
MRQISSLLQGLVRSLSVGRDRREHGGDGKAAAPAVLRTSGTVWGEGSETFAAVCSRRGEKGTNQDCSIVWEGFGCQEDTIFCASSTGTARGATTSPRPEKVAKRLVECAVRAWRRRRRGIAVDDCSAICLFFHSPPS